MYCLLLLCWISYYCYFFSPTVYETCKLGTHSPHSVGSQMELDTGKCSTSGFVLVDNPQSMKMGSNTAFTVGSISDYFLSLSNGWDMASFLRSLKKVLKALQFGSCSTSNSTEGHRSPCTVSDHLITLYYVASTLISFCCLIMPNTFCCL